MRYRYKGLAEVRATIRSGPGPETLTTWARQASSKDGKVWLVDKEGTQVALLASDLSNPSHWQGDTFTAGAEVLEVLTDASTPAEAGSKVSQALFRGGRDTIYFPVSTGSTPDGISLHIAQSDLSNISNWEPVS